MIQDVSLKGLHPCFYSDGTLKRMEQEELRVWGNSIDAAYDEIQQRVNGESQDIACRACHEIGLHTVVEEEGAQDALISRKNPALFAMMKSVIEVNVGFCQNACYSEFHLFCMMQSFVYRENKLCCLYNCPYVKWIVDSRARCLAFLCVSLVFSPSPFSLSLFYYEDNIDDAAVKERARWISRRCYILRSFNQEDSDVDNITIRDETWASLLKRYFCHSTNDIDRVLFSLNFSRQFTQTEFDKCQKVHSMCHVCAPMWLFGEFHRKDEFECIKSLEVSGQLPFNKHMAMSQWQIAVISLLPELVLSNYIRSGEQICEDMLRLHENVSLNVASEFCRLLPQDFHEPMQQMRFFDGLAVSSTKRRVLFHSLLRFVCISPNYLNLRMTLLGFFIKIVLYTLMAISDTIFWLCACFLISKAIFLLITMFLQYVR